MPCKYVRQQEVMRIALELPVIPKLIDSGAVTSYLLTLADVHGRYREDCKSIGEIVMCVGLACPFSTSRCVHMLLEVSIHCVPLIITFLHNVSYTSFSAQARTLQVTTEMRKQGTRTDAIVIVRKE
jgi:hypothetical protein